MVDNPRQEALTSTASGGATTGDQKAPMRPGEYLALKFMGDCKCGDCQLVPASVLRRWDADMKEMKRKLEAIGRHPDTPSLIKQYAKGMLDQ